MDAADDPTKQRLARLRREPPRFRQVTVRHVMPLTPRMLRVTLTGDELDGLVIERPAASVRLLLPSEPGGDLVMPTWQGNEFLMDDGRRPVLRTFTPRRIDPATGDLVLDIVVHGGGAASTWAVAAPTGAPAAISGPGRGYELDAQATALLLAGDETAIPAMAQLLEGLPADLPVQVHVEIADPSARFDDLSHHDQATVRWYDLAAGEAPGTALAAAVEAAELVDGEHVWAAGEAAAVQRIRKHLFNERGFPRTHATIRGYWKHGRAEGAGDSDV
jgi:NADPH-dependent ferric siderophore reductase